MQPGTNGNRKPAGTSVRQRSASNVDQAAARPFADYSADEVGESGGGGGGGKGPRRSNTGGQSKLKGLKNAFGSMRRREHHEA